MLSGKTAVVTGGGRGIGAAVVRELAEAGVRVIAAARSQAEIESVAAELAAQGHSVAALACDVTRPESIAEMAEKARKRFGPVDILVNNAGVVTSAPLKTVTLAEWERIFAVNVTGTFLCTQQFLPGMLERGWGRVVNVASIAGLTGAPYISTYAASKHAVIGFTRSMAAEVAAKGVTVNAVCPGYVDTPMTEGSLARIVAKTKLTQEQAVESLKAMSPQRRLFEPDEVAYLVRCLCDHRARGVNGQSIVLDGGALLK
jgi:3-hydroxybutyrate dehydrogenase